MSARELLADVLLYGGVALLLASAVGLFAMRDTYERLHFVGPTAIAAVAIALAVLVQEGPSVIALKAGLVAFFLVFTSPVLVHFTARAAREWERGDWRPGDPR
jgi:monovalent cation/proton antiporter MnhG/PhaG subunit